MKRAITDIAGIERAITDGWDFPVSFDMSPEPMPLQEALNRFRIGFEADGIRQEGSARALVLGTVVNGLISRYSFAEIESMANEYFDEKGKY